MGRRIVVALMVWLVAGPVAAEGIARIKSVAGVATVLRGRTKLPATPGLALLQSDVIVSGPNARVGLTFIDNTRFGIGPNSTVSLSQFEFNATTHKGRSLTSVDRGSLAVVSGQIAKENRDAMRVRTPTALLAARGTRFVVVVR